MSGRQLHHWAADPVEWVPREFNVKADSVCNIVMDKQAPHMYRHKDLKAILESRYNIKISTDGGVRGGRVTGAGWVIYAVQVDALGIEGKHVVALEGGAYIGRGMSSLEAEIRAMEEAMLAIAQHL